jgi:hypothetical protein
VGTCRERNPRRRWVHTEAEFLGEIQTKVLRVFLFSIHSHLYSFVRDFYFFKRTQPLTVFLKEKGGKPYPLPYGLRNPYRNLKSEDSQDYAQKPQNDCKFMSSGSGMVTMVNWDASHFLFYIIKRHQQERSIILVQAYLVTVVHAYDTF